MEVFKTNDLVRNFKAVSQIVSSGESVLIVRPHNDNFVIMQQSKYKQVEKILANIEYLNMLAESKAEAERGEVVEYTLDELDTIANDAVN